MPILDKWIETPLDFIEECIGSSVRNITNVKDYFRKRITNLKDINYIPSINDTQLDLIKPNSLVRCRCMVQDQFDPEYYLGQYETYNSNTHEKKMKFGVFQDVNSLQTGEEVVHGSGGNITLERQTLYCVPIPGENDWVKQKYASRSLARNQVEERKVSQAKRGRNEDTANDDGEKMDMNVESHHGADLSKRYCNGNQSRTATTAAVNGGSLSQNEVFDPNFPLPEKNQSPFFIIMYDNEERPKLNEVYEFIGIMSCDPELARATMGERNDCTDELAFGGDIMTAEERLVHCPPASLVPRIHCILAEKLIHSNPLLTSAVNCEGAFRVLDNEFESIRGTIIQSLARILYGDVLAAEYVLLNAISRVYGRVEPMALGKFSVNLIKCPAALDGRSLSAPQEVGAFFELITTKSHSIQLTISNLNETKFIPKKDYNANRLTSGLLQLSEGTHLICDETALQPGQLNSDGVKNLTAIGNLIQWQKVDYDFQFHNCEIKTDITMLIFSEAKSLLQCDCLVPISQQCSASQSASSLIVTMDYCLLEKIRIYMELCRMMDFNLTDEMQEVVKNDYVEMRENDRSAMNPETFHLLLVLARLVAISFGKKELTRELWQRTKDLEIQRNTRL